LSATSKGSESRRIRTSKEKSQQLAFPLHPLRPHLRDKGSEAKERTHDKGNTKALDGAADEDQDRTNGCDDQMKQSKHQRKRLTSYPASEPNGSCLEVPVRRSHKSPHLISRRT